MGTTMAKSKRSWKERLSRLKPRLPKYLRESWQELRKVTWPTRREAWKLTLAVFIFSGSFMILVVIIDSLFKVIAEELFL